MGYLCTRFAAIAICLTSIVVLSFSKLVVLRHPPTNNGYERNLTCVSEDNDDALIWNYDINPNTSLSGKNIFTITDFEPKKRMIRNFPKCALWNLTACVVDWWSTNEWIVANSTIKPMGPVFDYRWEGLKEYVFKETLEQQEYQLVTEVKESSGSAIFSARGLQNIYVLLCDSDVAQHQCFRIIIEESGNRKSTIQSCVNEVREPSRCRNNASCKVVATVERGPAGVIDPYEWRTFRIEWDSDKQVIRVYKITEDEPFLEGFVAAWISTSQLYIRSELSARVRFHFYGYHLTEKKEAVLSTDYFYQYGVNFCVKLLVHQCQKCKLRIDLLDGNNKVLAMNVTSWSKNLGVDGPVTWRPFQLTAIFPTLHWRRMRLKVQPILDGDGKGWWAIDKFHTCESVGSLRISTITIRQEKRFDSPIWPQVKCQKISYDKTAVVDTLSTHRINHNTNGLRQLLHGLRKSCRTSQCGTFGAGWSFCNPNGCTCDEGFEGSACSETCSQGAYGYNCDKECGSCYTGVCDGQNGYCYTGCQVESLLPPLCKKELEKPKVVKVTDTSVRIIQNVEPEASKMISSLSFEIQGIDLKYRPIVATRMTPWTYQANILELQRNRQYTVHAVAIIDNAKNRTQVKSQDNSFTTTSVGEVCFRIVRAEESLTLEYYKDSEGCANLLGAQYSLKLRKLPNEQFSEKYGPPLPYTFTDLQPYTEYEVIISITGGSIFAGRFRTLESAPGKVERLFSKNLFDTGVTLEWSAPVRRNGIITKYTVSIKLITLLGCAKLKRPTPPQNETLQEVNFTTASFSGLHPYAEYTATVIAYTSKAGPANAFTFTTTEATIPTSVVSNLTLDHKQLRLDWDQPLDCTTITGSINVKKLVLTKTSGPNNDSTTERRTNNNYYYVSGFGLAPYTSYKVRVHVVRDWVSPENSEFYQEVKGRTAPSAPFRIEIIELFDADFDTRSISLRWKPPNPANGELQSYRAVIKKGDTRLIDRTIKVSEGVCEQWTYYVCLENLNLPRDIATSTQLQLQIFAKNQDVKQFSLPGLLLFVPATKFIELPGRPLNLTVSREGQDVVTLKWKTPPFTPTKILQFRIHVEVLETFLLESFDTRFPMDINCTFKEKQEEYSAELRLPPSTKYRVSVVSVNTQNIISGVTETSHLMPEYVGFGSNEEPEVKQNGSLIEVKIPRVVNATRNTTVSIIVKGPSTCTPHHAQTSSSRVNLTKFVEKWEAAVYKVEKSTPDFLEIFAEQHHGHTSNCSLHVEETYTILFVVTDWFSGASANFTSSEITLINRELPQGTNLAWLIIAILIIAICLLLLFGWHWKRHRTPLKTSQQNILQLEPTMMGLENAAAPCTLNRASPSPNATINQVSIRQSSPDVVPLYNPNSCPVKVEEFEEHTKEALARGLLDPQYAMFPKSVEKPCEYAKLSENLPKNRYKDRIPYDDTRVVLQKIPGESNSDYINASYIQGYRKRKAYIATQGPKQKTVKDFWRMIWQEEVRVICMLANILEGGKKKCEQYWPEIGTKVKYGNILISNISHQVFADYTFRTFTLNYKKETREVTHLHYTGWPDHGVPKYTQSLVAYLKKLLATPAGKGPVVVHCSAGVGRTGTIILCDICLRQAFAERVIDVPAVILKMREDRANMVDNAQQYLLAHLAIVESMVIEQTQIPCTELFPERIMELRKQLPSDIKRLQDTVWQDQALHSLELSKHITKGEVATERLSRLDSANPASSRRNMINAVSVDGVKMKNQYLALRQPSPSTLSDFWKLIAEKNIELVVILQRPNTKDSTCCDIMPGESVFVPTPNIQVESKGIIEEEEHFTKDTLTLTDTSKKEDRKQPVTVVTCTGWGRGKTGKPPTAAALVLLWIASEKIPRKEGPTLVLCRDGVTGCGLYLALSFLLERIAVERECDVISAVRAVRRSKTEFVQSQKQFEYLYDAAVYYVKCFETYANFT